MKKRIRLIILIIILFLLAHFTFTSSRKDNETLITDRLVASVYQPVTHLFHSITNFFSELFDQYVILFHVKEENRGLKESIQRLKLKNRSLEVLLGSKKDETRADRKFAYLNKKLKRVNILGFDPFSQSKTIWIDAGRDDGIDLNQVVVSGDGLVGRVIQIFDKSSKVLLLIDSYFSVDSINERTKLRCLVRGLRTGELEASRLPYLSRVEYLQQGNEMFTGDRLVTSGLGGIYPKGIPIGRLIDVKELKSEYFEKSLVMPAVDFLKLQGIYVLLDGP